MSWCGLDISWTLDPISGLRKTETRTVPVLNPTSRPEGTVRSLSAFAHPCNKRLFYSFPLRHSCILAVVHHSEKSATI